MFHCLFLKHFSSATNTFIINSGKKQPKRTTTKLEYCTPSPCNERCQNLLDKPRCKCFLEIKVPVLFLTTSTLHQMHQKYPRSVKNTPPRPWALPARLYPGCFPALHLFISCASWHLWKCLHFLLLLCLVQRREAKKSPWDSSSGTRHRLRETRIIRKCRSSALLSQSAIPNT